MSGHLIALWAHSFVCLRQLLCDEDWWWLPVTESVIPTITKWNLLLGENEFRPHFNQLFMKRLGINLDIVLFWK